MQSTEPIIHVGILSNATIHFVLNGDFKSGDGTMYSGKQKAEYKKGNVFFHGEPVPEILLEPLDGNASFDLTDVVIGIDFHWERKENQRFKGALKFIVEGKKLTAINRIPVEDYLTSVISSEMSASASEELLKAHAVISRSWLLCPLQGARGKEQEVSNTNAAEPQTSNLKPQTSNLKLQT